MEDYAAYPEQTDEFEYDIGEVVFVIGPGFINENGQLHWSGRIVDRWYDPDSYKHLPPYWYQLEAIGEPPKRFTNGEKIIVHETEISRY